MTFHRVRFSSPLNAYKTSISGPKCALHWLFGPQSATGEAGLRTRQSDIWGGAAFYADLSEAQFVYANVSAEFRFDHDVVEAWHAVLCPISHKGETNWFGSIDRAA